MKKIVFILTMVFVLVSINNCGGSSGTEVNNVNNKYKKSIELTSDNNTSLTLKGKGSDKLTLAIPPLSVGAKDQNITVVLKYLNDLPLIEIDKDIEFTAPVKLRFISDNIQDGNTTLVYHASDRKFYIPSIVKDHTLEAYLQHFSKYGFDNLPTKSDRLNEDIHSRLSDIETTAENDTLGELRNKELSDLYIKISAYEGDEKYDEMIKSYADIITQAAINTMKHYKDNDLSYFSGLCPTDVLFKAMSELSDVRSSTKEMLKYKSIIDSTDEDILNEYYLTAGDLAKSILEKSKNAWSKIEIPSCDKKFKLWEYIQCTNKYISNLEFTIIFYDELGIDATDMAKEVKQELEDAIASDAMVALSSKDCTCMFVYLGILDTYFADTQKDLISLLNDETKKCGTECPLLWDITIDYININDGHPTLIWNGHAEFKDIYIEQKDDAWVELPDEQRVACEPYRDKYKGITPKASFVSGDLEEDFEIDWFYIIVDDNGKPHIRLKDYNIYADIYEQLNEFQPFSVSGQVHGTTTYTFTPHVIGFKYPVEW